MKLNSGRFWLKTSVFTLLGAASLLLALAALYFVRFDAAAVRHAVEQSFARSCGDGPASKSATCASTPQAPPPRH